MGQNARENVTLAPTARSRAIHGLRNDLTKELDRLDVTARAGPKALKAEGGDYANARAAFKSVSEEIDAVGMGRKILKGDLDVTVSELAKMRPEVKDSLRAGLRQDISDMINRNTQSAINLLSDSKVGLWEKLRALSPSEEAFAAFRADIAKEVNKARVDSYINPRAGSKTAGLLQDTAELGRVPNQAVEAAANVLRGNNVQALMQMFGGVKDRLIAPDPKTAGDIAATLLERSQPAQSVHLERIMSQPVVNAMPPATRSRLAQMLISGAAPNLTPIIENEPLRINVRNRNRSAP